MSKHIQHALIICALVILSSCEKVIDFDLNSSNSQLVIEGNISDQGGSCIVQVSQSVNYDESNVFPPISGAAVLLSDDEGNSELLTETSTGIYTSLEIHGVPGRSYTLQVTVDGQSYTAVSHMPLPVAIDSLSMEEYALQEELYVQVQYLDPEGIDNFYRFVQVINGVEQTDILLSSDRLQDGDTMKSLLQADDYEDGLSSGDKVTVYLQSIDESVYDYFRTLLRVDGNAAPANPLSNFDGGVLGYFSAYSVTSKSIIVMEQ